MATINGVLVSFDSVGDISRLLQENAREGIARLKLTAHDERLLCGVELSHVRDMAHAATTRRVDDEIIFYFGD